MTEEMNLKSAIANLTSSEAWCASASASRHPCRLSVEFKEGEHVCEPKAAVHFPIPFLVGRPLWKLEASVVSLK